MNPGSPDQEQLAALHHYAPDRQDAAESNDQGARVRRSGSRVLRLPGTRLIVTLVGDQLPRTIAKLPHLEAATWNDEKRIPLLDVLRRTRCKSRCLCSYGIQVRTTDLDFDVAGHARLTLSGHQLRTSVGSLLGSRPSRSPRCR